MGAGPTEEELIGSRVKVTTADDKVIDGVVYTYVPKEGILVLAQNDCANFRIIRTPFIKNISIAAKSDQCLPPHLDARSKLPSMHAGRGLSIFKYAKVELKNAEEARSRPFADVKDPSAIPIGALDAFSTISRIYPNVVWDSMDEVIKVTDEVLVTPDPQWSNPAVKTIDGAGSESRNMVDRITKLLANK